jgi:hypothetical protein
MLMRSVGLISIGSVAVSTAVGGYLLTRYNISPLRSILYLLITWSIIFVTYLLGMSVGCEHTGIQALYTVDRYSTWGRVCANLHTDGT